MSSLKKTLKNSDGNLLIAKDEQLRKKERKEKKTIQIHYFL